MFNEGTRSIPADAQAFGSPYFHSVLGLLLLLFGTLLTLFSERSNRPPEVPMKTVLQWLEDAKVESLEFKTDIWIGELKQKQLIESGKMIKKFTVKAFGQKNWHARSNMPLPHSRLQRSPP